MIDARLLPLQHKLLDPLGRVLVAHGLRADAITVGGCFIGLGAGAAASMGAFGVALILLALNRLCDGLDGAVARMTTPSERGAFLDVSLDYVFYVSLPLGFVLFDPSANAVPGAILIASFALTGTSFLTYAAIEAKRGEQASRSPGKGIYYLSGLTEGFETIAFLAVCCLLPSWFPALAYGFAAACLVTAVCRYWWGWQAFAPSHASRRQP